jgi:glycerol-1-phosphate dehydrogenase [NAD(P)+]
MMRIWNVPVMEVMPFSDWEDARDVALLYSGPAFEAVQEWLPSLNFVSQAEPVAATLEHWETLLADLHGDVVYAIGGGLVVDAAKYAADRLDLPLVCLPTALSVDAFLTWASGVRRDGCVYYVETKPPDTLVIDFDVLSQAPPAVRAAGICDVLSTANGSWDWKFAEEAGQNPSGMHFIPWVYDTAQTLLQSALACAGATIPAAPEWSLQ